MQEVLEEEGGGGERGPCERGPRESGGVAEKTGHQLPSQTMEEALNETVTQLATTL